MEAVMGALWGQARAERQAWANPRGRFWQLRREALPGSLPSPGGGQGIWEAGPASPVSVLSACSWLWSWRATPLLPFGVSLRF